MIAQQQTYNYFYRNPELRDSVQALEDFYYSKINENMGKLREMEEKIDDHDFVAAESLRDQTITDNIIEQAYKEVLDLYMKFEKGIFNAADSADLWLWATSCYYYFGKAVPMAQTLFNTVFESSTVFIEDCSGFMATSSAAIVRQNDVSLKLYPNPNRDIFFIESADNNITRGHIKIYDIQGMALFEGEIHFEKGFDLRKILSSSGVYLLDITYVANETVFTVKKKVVFIK
jgi:hypothetical protein